MQDKLMPKGTQDSKSAAQIILMAIQCSQRIIQWIVLLLIFHVISSQIATMIDPSLAGPLAQIMDKVEPVYQLSIGGYLGKSAVENVLKIWNSVKAVDSSDGSTYGDG